MKPIAILFSLCVVGLLLLLVIKAGEADAPPRAEPVQLADRNIDASVSRVNAALRQHWKDEGLEPAELADELTVFRRLSLALHGTIPSLEEINSFNADSPDDRIERWLLKMLADKRFHDYFSDRLARVLSGVEEGQFVIFRRDRLRDWLSEQLRADRPWPEITTELIAADGLWTSNGAANFITAASIPDEGLDESKLAGRTVRAFLGQRIDCAQCHDHPFDTWKQNDFEGLAAFFGRARVTIGGVIDDPTSDDDKPVEYKVIDPGEQDGRVVAPRVPFHEEWMQEDGSRRQRLASWVIHPDNRRFERAIANRVWGLMFGRSWYDPVDDLGHPAEDAADHDLLDVVGREFRNNGGRLHFLIRLIAQSDAFRQKSEVSWADEDLYSQMSREWAVFPLVRLRPEQIIGTMVQAGSVKTIDRNSNLFVRFMRFNNESDFLKAYGDAEDDELLQQSGTIPQALLRMNGKFTRELTNTRLFSAAGQILNYSGDDEAVVQNCFLACLSRYPSEQERKYFVERLRAAERDGKQLPAEAESTDENGEAEFLSKEDAVRDMYWVLFNSPGFSWNR
ncbi:DUF1549 domain-containing protein [Fuerstiella marisgermanici]|uniref:DUF1553 domain-containing protein n=1 Tax=Fuerstiella marisgermanici TaxID=1891926 RepID=A0A1P8WQ61_9PLAN|nr:DUF1549 domain-containing protein [Fuerstiella marisgermanici]APZ96192.1 hypothetical protein Fuma_05860 [Fuerstiella marisgermanici]